MKNEFKTPKVTLMTWTKLPFETVYAVWEASKGDGPLRTPEQIERDVPKGEVRDLFRRVLRQHIPIGEHVDMVFMLENVSVSWREQAVRHRIGVGPSPERLGMDMVQVDRIPELADSSFWSQSMRLEDQSTFARNGRYRVPESLLAHPNGQYLLLKYMSAMEIIERTYEELVKAGIPMEDARELIPLGAQHRISWRLNLESLSHIVGKRGCWILQLGLWGPVIEGMIRELVEKVDPIFAELVTPPCLEEDEFKGCVYLEENRRRYSGEDKHPPCPMHFTQHHIPDYAGKYYRDAMISSSQSNASSSVVQQAFMLPMAAEMRERAERYRKFWNRDPYSGKRLLPVVP